ncbi:MAG: hypothetical protein C5B43_02580 [Verrucomicrobia bacterium]|nr:MAG: hypothetical protein C5B43_02580 [Verrucomicrobiota bacterium]
MKYLTQVLILVTAVAVSSSMAMAADTETFIMFKNNTPYKMKVSGIKDKAGKSIIEINPGTPTEGQKITFPMSEKNEKTPFEITLLDKNGNELHTWKDLRFDTNGYAGIKPPFEDKEKRKFEGYIQVLKYLSTADDKSEYHNYTIELKPTS